ncbi:hypothetical protein [uncultured Rothia sp.]|uniref:hypothetical protein n=1 Tax=uncultured Rothia sp. TaxID=316088 RepID=UPI0032166278
MKFTKLYKAGALAAISMVAMTGCGLKPSASAVPDFNPGTIQPIAGAKNRISLLVLKTSPNSSSSVKLPFLLLKPPGSRLPI